jgi:ATP-dependent RNA helicase HelY
LPIFFVFSRQGCDDAVRECVEAGVSFLDGREQRRVEQIAEQYVSELSEDDLVLLGYRSWLTSLQTGIAAHHAGMVTPFKEAVEECFSAGLMHVVFATETLALGVNLPARSVVIESLSRYRGDGHVMLTPGEYTQLTGRAGRRGIDAAGHAYTIWNPYTGFRETAELVASTKFELTSAFRPTYNMAANLISTRTRDDAVGLLHRSFAQFRADRRIVTWSERLTTARDELKQLTEDHRQRYGTATKAPATRADVDPAEVSDALKKMQPGHVIEQPRRHGAAHLLVIGTTSRKDGEHRIRVAGMKGKTLMLGVSDFDQVPVPLDRIDLPKPYAPNRREFHRAAARNLRQFVSEAGLDVTPARVRSGTAANDKERKALERRIERARGRGAGLEHQVRTAKKDLGSTLDAIVALLNEVQCAEGWSLTEAGELVTGIFHERDLPIAMALHRGLFDDLDPAHTAALASTLSYEHRGRNAPETPWFPTRDLKERASQIEHIILDVQRREMRLGVNQTIASSNGFAAIAHAWASGIDLQVVLEHEDIGAGDFVRNIRQLVDMLRQIAEVAPNRTTSATARNAIRAIDRGVVAAATRLSEGAAEVIAAIDHGERDEVLGETLDEDE